MEIENKPLYTVSNVKADIIFSIEGVGGDLPTLLVEISDEIDNKKFNNSLTKYNFISVKDKNLILNSEDDICIILPLNHQRIKLMKEYDRQRIVVVLSNEKGHINNIVDTLIKIEGT